jgi:hypothetical protein
MDKQSNGHPEPPIDKYPPDPPTVCRYCRGAVTLVSMGDVFPSGRVNGKMYLCQECGAWVRANPETGDPIGYLADAELMRWRRATREAMAPITRHPRWSRSELVQAALDVPDERARVAMLSIGEIKNLIVWLMRKGPHVP